MENVRHSRRRAIIIVDPLTLIILVVVLIVLLPVLIWLGIAVLWIAIGLFAGVFVYFFLLYLFAIPILAAAGGIAAAIMIWAALARG